MGWNRDEDFHAEKLIRIIEKGGSIDDLERAVNAGPRYINGRDPRGGGETPLICAARHGATDMVRELLRRGASLYLSDDHGNNALHCARYEDTVRVLLDGGAHIDTTNYEWETALMLRARQRNIPAIELLLSRGADTRIRNKRGLTVHDIAEDTAGLILEYEQQNPEKVFRESFTAAVKAGDAIDVAGILKKGVSKEDLDEALILAIRFACPSTVKLLIDAGAEICRADEELCPLSEAVERGLLTVVKMFLDAGIDVNGRDRRGQTPLIRVFFADEAIREDLCDMFIDAGADIELTDKDGKTFIDYAVEAGEAGLLKHVLSRVKEGSPERRPRLKKSGPVHPSRINA